MGDYYRENRGNVLEKMAAAYRADPELRRKKIESARLWRLENPERYKDLLKKCRARRKASRPVGYAIEGRIRCRKQSQTIKGRQRLHRQNKRRYAQTAFAENHNKDWTPEEIRAIFDGEKSATEIAKTLGRSRAAITLARRRFRALAPVGWTTPIGFARRGTI